jgi:hypothetical protein
MVLSAVTGECEQIEQIGAMVVRDREGGNAHSQFLVQQRECTAPRIATRRLSVPDGLRRLLQRPAAGLDTDLPVVVGGAQGGWGGGSRSELLENRATEHEHGPGGEVNNGKIAKDRSGSAE